MALICLVLGCQGRPRGPVERPARVAADAAVVIAEVGPATGPEDAGGADDRPANLLRLAELAWTQPDDRELARGFLRRALAAISRQHGSPVPLVATLAQGLADPDYASRPVAEVALSPAGERVAVGHGRLLSVLELGLRHRLYRLATHPARLRRVVLGRSGERIATLADDGIARLLNLDGEPGPSWPLELPRDPAHPERLAAEAAYRASWLDFSPDARFLFLADTGVSAPGPHPLRRLRVYSADHGQLLATLRAGEAELLDYTARRDGTVAVLFAGRPPQLYRAEPGTELPLSSALRGAAAQDCTRATRYPADGERGWVVSPDRRWLATLAAPTTLCLWDLDQRSLVAARVLFGGGLAPPRLLSLLSPNTTPVVLVSTEGRRGERRSYLLDPQSGQRLAELGDLAAVMPLDEGGAVLSGHPLAGAQRRGVQLWLLRPDLQVVQLAIPELLASRCLAAFPDAVAGDGRLALFSPMGAASPDCPPALVELLARPTPTAPLRRLAEIGSAPIAAADFFASAGLVIVDAAARVQTLRGTQLRSATTPAVGAVTRLGFSRPGDGEQLQLGTADGLVRELWTTGGTLRTLSAPGPAPGAPSGPLTPVVSPDGRWRAEVESGPGSSASPRLSLRAVGADAIRWQVPIGPTALAFTPDGRLLIVGGAGGSVVWLRVADGSVRLRLQLAPEGAVASSADGHFELLGAVEHPEDYVCCRAGTYQIPLTLCTEQLGGRGLLSAALRP
jgi:hypothetical protein